MPSGERYLDIHKVAERVGLSTKSIRAKVRSREFPAPFKWAGGWRWLESDLDRWMVQNATLNVIDPDSVPEEARKIVEDRGKSGKSSKTPGAGTGKAKPPG